MLFTNKLSLLSFMLFALSANVVAEPLSAYCAQKAIETSLELKTQPNATLTNDDIKIARMAAEHTCIKIYTALEIAPPDSLSTSTDLGPVPEKSNPKKSDHAKDSKNSIWERLTQKRTRKDVNPMLKKHRTGGK